LVDVEVVLVEVVVVETVLVVVLVAGGAVEVVVVVGAGVVVVVDGIEVVLLVVLLVVPSLPGSEAITTTATISPRTTATKTASAHLTPRLIPPPGGCPGPGGGSGGPIRRVGSSCIAGECRQRSGRSRGP
jgi:hypothetical protein